jgi:hypothetical protein
MARTSRVHDPRGCERCHQGLPLDSAPNRRFCPSCADARRALTYARKAHDLAIDAGLDSIAGRLGVIVGELETSTT